MTRQADLSPPLGFPGGPCHVVNRIMDEVRNPRLREELIDDVEEGLKLDNRDAAKVYDLEVEKGVSKTRFKKLIITPHAQYRMDQRGVTVTEVRMALQGFQKHWGDLRSQGQARYVDEDLARGEPILWTDPRHRLAVVFATPGGGNAARIVTVYWQGQSDPRPPGQDGCKVADAGDWSPGVKTLVSPKSERNLPTDEDREKQQALPSGAATPGGVSDSSNKRDDKRDVPKFELNRPDNGIPERPRTLPTPGEDYGHPVKEDYNYVTRRSMTADEARIIEANFQRRRTSAERVADLYLWEDLGPDPIMVAAAYMGDDDLLEAATHEWKPPKLQKPPARRQRRQRGDPRIKSRRQYIQTRPKKNLTMKKRHKRLQKYRRYKEYRKNYMREYRRRGGKGFRRRADLEEGTAKTAEGITFTFERENPKQEIDHPGANVNYSPTSPSHYRRDKGEDSGQAPAGGHPGVDKHVDEASPSGSRVVNDGFGTHWDGFSNEVKTAATMDEIVRRTSPDVLARAKGVQVRLSRADQKRGIWTFQAKGSKGVYRIRVKGIRKGNVRKMSVAQVKVSCECDFFRYQGPEHWAKVNNYLYGRPRGTAANPKIRDPRAQHWACKHVLAALNLARKYRFSSEGTAFPHGVEIVPDFDWADRWGSSVRSVADRFLGNGSIE